MCCGMSVSKLFTCHVSRLMDQRRPTDDPAGFGDEARYSSSMLYAAMSQPAFYRLSYLRVA